MATEKHGCEARVYDDRSGHQCMRNGVNRENEQWWCKVHTPSIMTAKADAWMDNFRKEQAEKSAASARRARREELRDECVHLVLDVTRGHIIDQDDAVRIIRELDALEKGAEG